MSICSVNGCKYLVKKDASGKRIICNYHYTQSINNHCCALCEGTETFEVAPFCGACRAKHNALCNVCRKTSFCKGLQYTEAETTRCCVDCYQAVFSAKNANKKWGPGHCLSCDGKTDVVRQNGRALLFCKKCTGVTYEMLAAQVKEQNRVVTSILKKPLLETPKQVTFETDGKMDMKPNGKTYAFAVTKTVVSEHVVTKQEKIVLPMSKKTEFVKLFKNLGLDVMIAAEIIDTLQTTPNMTEALFADFCHIISVLKGVNAENIVTCVSKYGIQVIELLKQNISNSSQMSHINAIINIMTKCDNIDLINDFLKVIYQINSDVLLLFTAEKMFVLLSRRTDNRSAKFLSDLVELVNEVRSEDIDVDVLSKLLQ